MNRVAAASVVVALAASGVAVGALLALRHPVIAGHDQKVSYALGVEVAQATQKLGIVLDPVLFQAALLDVRSKRELRLTRGQLDDALRWVQREAQAQQARALSEQLQHEAGEQPGPGPTLELELRAVSVPGQASEVVNDPAGALERSSQRW